MAKKAQNMKIKNTFFLDADGFLGAHGGDKLTIFFMGPNVDVDFILQQFCSHLRS